VSEIEKQFREIELQMAELDIALHEDERLFVELGERCIQRKAMLKRLEDRLSELLCADGAEPVH
jgi:hypothetical protein